MIRTFLVILCAGSLGCGDDDMTPLDGGTDVVASDCLYVETGATGGDGSEDRPFGTLAEALAASGERICLGSGAFELPASFDRAAALEGVGADQTLLSGSIGCATAPIMDAFDSAIPREDAEVVVNARARLALRELTVQGCAIGLYARDVIVEIENVEFQDVQASVVLEGSARATVMGSTLRTGTVAGAPTLLQRAVVQATPGSTFRSEGTTTIMAGGGNFGVLSRGGTVAMSSTRVLAGNAGVWIQEAVSATLGPDLELDGQTDDGAFFGHNRIRGGVATFDGVIVRAPAVAGLIVDEGANVQLDRTSFAGITRFGLVTSNGEVSLGDDVSFELMGEGTGLYVGTEPAMPATVTVTGSWTSTTESDGTTHAYVRQGGALVAADASVSLSGGVAGVFVADGGSAELGGSVVLDGMRTGLINQATAELTVSDLTGTNLEFGIAAVAGATAMVSDSTLSAVGIGIVGDGSRLILDTVSVSNAGVRGIVLRGDAHASASTLDDVVIDGSDDIGFQISGPHQVDVVGGRFEGARRGGIEASVGADLDVDGSEFRANERMGVAFYDAEGSVMGARFGGTLLQGGRADEIRITAAEGTTREVEIGSLNFDLDVPRDCSGGGCVLMIANGSDAVGIVTPNCIVESVGEAATFTTIEENGGTITLVGPSAWASVLAGRDFDLGLGSGSATPPPDPPSADDPLAPPRSPI